MIFFYTNCLKIGLQGWWNLPLNSFHHLFRNQNLWKDWNFPYISFFFQPSHAFNSTPKVPSYKCFLSSKNKNYALAGFFFFFWAKLHLISAYKKLWRKIQLFHSWNIYVSSQPPVDESFDVSFRKSPDEESRPKMDPAAVQEMADLLNEVGEGGKKLRE